jgi:thioredoxin 1
MRRIFSLGVLLLTLIFGACADSQSQEPGMTLPAKEFAKKIDEPPGATIVDVRTAEEFSGGHLPNAKNFDWQGDLFAKQISSLDKSKPVFIYCHSGNRSRSAAKSMRAQGFKKVYELEGGITKWQAADLPETTLK